MKQNETKNAQKRTKKFTRKFPCEICNKIFKSRTTLWRHKKKCKNVKYLEESKNIKIVPNSENPEVEFLLSKLEIEKSKLEIEKKEKKEMWKAFHKQQALLKKVVDQNSEMIPRLGNNNNNKISINVVLNEKCKGAMNLEDFVEKLQVLLESRKIFKNWQCSFSSSFIFA